MEGIREGLIVKGIGGFYYIRCPDGSICELRAQGKLRHKRLCPLIGDKVRFIPGDGDSDGWIVDILPRENELIRPAVANIRYLIVVLAPRPEPDLLMVDTLLAMAAKQDISPAIAVNKCDLDSTFFPEIAAQYRGLGAPLLSLSARSGEGLDSLRSLLREGICCFAGQSGVGKSTLSAAATGIELQTGEISRKISRGKHTTRHAELFIQGDYQVLDTPGFSLLELWEGLEPVHLQDYYPEFTPCGGQCRFAPCYHLSEPDCAVRAAVQSGSIDARRWERYCVLLEKTKEAWKNRYH